MESLLKTSRHNGLSEPLLRELQGVCSGTVYDRHEHGFAQQTRLWNGNLVCTSKVVCCPLDAQDVSRIVLFCSKHHLSFSVKAGGYAVAGWSIAGDVIIDLCLLDVIDIETPRPATPASDDVSASASRESSYASTPTVVSRQEWTSLREMPSNRPTTKPNKGKGRQANAMDIDGHAPIRPSHMLPRAESSIGVGGKRVRSTTPERVTTTNRGLGFGIGVGNGVPASTLMKRRKAEREAIELMKYDSASANVASFLKGDPLSADPRYPSRDAPAIMMSVDDKSEAGTSNGGQAGMAPPAGGSIGSAEDPATNNCGPLYADPSPEVLERDRLAKAHRDNDNDRTKKNAKDAKDTKATGSAGLFSYMDDATPSSANTAAGKKANNNEGKHRTRNAASSDDSPATKANPTSGSSSGPVSTSFLSSIGLSGSAGSSTSNPVPSLLGSLQHHRRPPLLPQGFSPSTRPPAAVGTHPVGAHADGTLSPPVSGVLPKVDWLVDGVVKNAEGVSSGAWDGLYGSDGSGDEGGTPPPAMNVPTLPKLPTIGTMGMKMSASDSTSTSGSGSSGSSGSFESASSATTNTSASSATSIESNTSGRTIGKGGAQSQNLPSTDSETGRTPITPSTIDQLSDEKRKDVEAASTALPDGDIALPAPGVFLRAAMNPGYGSGLGSGFGSYPGMGMGNEPASPTDVPGMRDIMERENGEDGGDGYGAAGGDGDGESADPFGYLSMPVGPRSPGSPGTHVHGDGVLDHVGMGMGMRVPVGGMGGGFGTGGGSGFGGFERPGLPARASTTARLAVDLDAVFGNGLEDTDMGSSGASDPFAYASSSSAPAPAPAHTPGFGRTPQPGDEMGGVSAGLPAAPVHPHAYVTFGAGMQQREVDLFTAAHPLPARSVHMRPGDGGEPDAVVPYHVPFAAHPVGSAVMMLGGFGFISRLHGLSTDNLVEVEMVLADGRIVIASETENTDLWFAIRGGGPAFGIATRYKARAFPVPIVFAGNLIYRFHRATAPSLMKHYRDCIKGAPRELYANLLLTAGPADQDSLVVVQICYAGPRSKGIEFLHALASWEGEPCLLNEVGEKSFLAQQDSVAQILRGQKGRKWFIRSTLIASLPDEVIHKTVAQFADTPIGCTWLFELIGGALADTEDSCIPKEQREATFNCAALHQWDIHVDDPRCVTSAEEWIHDTLGSVSTGAPFTCFLGRHEPAHRVKACFGSHWDRLEVLKRRYDPRGVMKHNFWPGGEDTLEPASP